MTDVAVLGDTAHIDLWYPRLDGKTKYVEVGLVDVRATDGIRISYDFERDGWVVEQNAPTWVDKGSHLDTQDNWTEVAFCGAWALEPPEYRAAFGAT